MMRVYVKAGEDPVTVNTGFNWWAFVFPGPWALFNGLLFPGLLGIAIPMSGVVAGANPHTAEGAILMALITPIMMLIYGFKGNDRLCSKLEKDGYFFTTTGTQSAHATHHSPDDAIQKLERLTDLREKGALSQEEFDELKLKIFGK